MNVLVIGGCHTGSYGIQAHLGFARQWAAHLETAAQEPINLHCLSMVRLEQIDSLIDQYLTEMMAADLIVLQLGHYELSWRQSFSKLFAPGQASAKEPSVYTAMSIPRPQYSPEKLHKVARPSRRSVWRDGTKTAVLQAYQLTYKELPYLTAFRERLADTFAHLAMFREKIILLTPFPTLNKVDYWLRCQCHTFIIDKAIQQSFAVADTFEAIPRQQAFFQADGVHLNSLGHTVLALFLSELPCVVDFRRDSVPA